MEQNKIELKIKLYEKIINESVNSYLFEDNRFDRDLIINSIYRNVKFKKYYERLLKIYLIINSDFDFYMDKIYRYVLKYKNRKHIDKNPPILYVLLKNIFYCIGESVIYPPFTKYINDQNAYLLNGWIISRWNYPYEIKKLSEEDFLLIFEAGIKKHMVTLKVLK